MTRTNRSLPPPVSYRRAGKQPEPACAETRFYRGCADRLLVPDPRAVKEGGKQGKSGISAGNVCLRTTVIEETQPRP